ncbi:ParB/RepB/Spo0J family partition protein [Sulfurimonas sp.]|uniref:ParB/RepB/Spo0J family partition protein n=1 Tax=Sulfurimonas sp. TaxID=2022749 RepID=UPI0025E7A13E|nr:ParB/RepB/Spo0J family partition protein [Sulfurimonas sp.]
MAGSTNLKPKRKDISASNTHIVEKIKGDIKSHEKTSILIESIKSPKYHDRRYINKHSIVELSDSIKAKGLIYPIVVRILNDGSYERIIGYRRLEAYKILKEKKIPAIILKNISDADAILLMATENIQREDLSVYDETLALLDYLGVSLELNQKDTIKILNRYKNFSSGSVELTQEEKLRFENIENILAKTGKVTTNALVNRLSILNVHQMLKVELSKGDLSISIAQILNKIDNEKILKVALKEVLEQGYSKRETSSYVNSLLPSKESKPESGIKRISKIKLDQLDKNKKIEIENLINKILSLIDEK